MLSSAAIADPDPNRKALLLLHVAVHSPQSPISMLAKDLTFEPEKRKESEGG